MALWTSKLPNILCEPSCWNLFVSPISMFRYDQNYLFILTAPFVMPPNLTNLHCNYFFFFDRELFTLIPLCVAWNCNCNYACIIYICFILMLFISFFFYVRIWIPVRGIMLHYICSYIHTCIHIWIHTYDTYLYILMNTYIQT